MKHIEYTRGQVLPVPEGVAEESGQGGRDSMTSSSMLICITGGDGDVNICESCLDPMTFENAWPHNPRKKREYDTTKQYKSTTSTRLHLRNRLTSIMIRNPILPSAVEVEVYI